METQLDFSTLISGNTSLLVLCDQQGFLHLIFWGIFSSVLSSFGTGSYSAEDSRSYRSSELFASLGAALSSPPWLEFVRPPWTSGSISPVQEDARQFIAPPSVLTAQRG